MKKCERCQSALYQNELHDRDACVAALSAKVEFLQVQLEVLRAEMEAQVAKLWLRGYDSSIK